MAKMSEMSGTVFFPKQPGMRPLLIQQLLRKGRGFLGIADEYKLTVRTHPRFNNLVQFVHQGENLSEPLVQQCRGVILDMADQWRCVARPLDHIFEWSHPEAPAIDWNQHPQVEDKVDGIMCYMYFYDGGWHVGSLQCPAGSNILPKIDTSVHDLFWHTFMSIPGYSVPPKPFEHCTFQWEMRHRLIVPVVVRQLTDIGTLNLVAVRHNPTGEETSPERFCDQGIRPYIGTFVDEAGYTSTKEVLQAVVSDGLTYGEGNIIKMPNFVRVAVTHPMYDTARRFREQLNLEWVVENIRSVKPNLNLFDFAQDWAHLHTMIAHSYADLIVRMVRIFAEENTNADDANFAQSVKRYPFGRLLQQRRNGEIKDFPEGLRKVPIEELLSWMEVPARKEKAA